MSTLGSTDASWLRTVCATFLDTLLASMTKLVEADADVVKKLMPLEAPTPWSMVMGKRLQVTEVYPRVLRGLARALAEGCWR